MKDNREKVVVRTSVIGIISNIILDDNNNQYDKYIRK